MTIQGVFENGTVAAVLSFSEVDYILFGCILTISALIGIYYGCFGTRQATTKDYLQGGKTMTTFPIAMSLIASHLSGITLLGIPAEVYTSGTQYAACTISIILVSIAVIYVYLPAFIKLQTISCYEYLEVRFNSTTRSIGSFLYIVMNFFHIAIVIYVPCLGLNQMTGVNMHYLAPIICIVCIFYTTIGGLKAVVITDALQFAITIFTMTVILCLGTYYSGGLALIWQKADSTGRLEFFNMNFDPTERSTFWGITIGLTTTWIGTIGVNPSSIQRYLALPSYEAAKRSIIILCLGVVLTKSISIFTGLIIYARYSDCDLLSTLQVKRMDQLLPYYVLDVTRNIPGLPGLFIAGVFSTALSTMSASLNTMAGTIYQDFLKQRMPNDVTEKTINITMKSIVVIIGIMSLGLVFVVEKLGGVLQLSLSFYAVSIGPMVGLFTLGMLFASANSIGAIVGTITSTVLSSVLVAGSQYYTAAGKIKVENKPLYTYGCDFNVTSEVFTNKIHVASDDTNKSFNIFFISFYFFTFIGSAIVLIVGLFVSWITKDKDAKPVDRDLLSPCIYWALSKTTRNKNATKYETVQYNMVTASANKSAT